MRARVPRRPAAPPILDPILRTWERIDVRRRGIRPIRGAAGLLGIELTHHRGRPVALEDGTVVRAGDLIGRIHYLNDRVREAAARGTIFSEGFREARADLRALATWAAALPPDRRPVAYRGGGVLVALARRAGFEIHPRPRTPWTRLEEWYFRWLLARWSPEGRARLGRGHGALRAADIWLSARELHARYGTSRID